MKTFKSRIFFAFLAACVLGLVSFGSVLAQSEGVPDLTISGKTSYKVGEPLRLTAWLLDSAGAPIRDGWVRFYLDGAFAGSARTDSDGRADLRLVRQLPAGTYLIEAVYDGRGIGPLVRASVEILYEPSLLTIQVLPPMSGVAFTLDGRPFQSREDGLAEIAVQQPGFYDLSLLPLENDNEGTRTTFKIWDSGSSDASRIVRIAGDEVFQAGFEVQHQVEFQFFDQDGNRIPPLRVSSIGIRSSNGAFRTIEEPGPAWLEGSVIFNRVSGLDSVAVVHAIQSVVVDGSNVVNRGQQRMTVYQAGVLSLEVLVFDTEFGAQDLLFRQAIGDGVEITFPDGSVRLYTFDDRGMLALNGLARGDYRARLTGVSGYSIPVSIALSRSQAIHLPALTILDMIAVGCLFLTAAGGIIAVGRLKKRWMVA